MFDSLRGTSSLKKYSSFGLIKFEIVGSKFTHVKEREEICWVCVIFFPQLAPCMGGLRGVIDPLYRF